MVQILRRAILLIGLGVLSQKGQAQKVFTTDATWKSGIKVYVVDQAYKADLVVYNVDYNWQAKGKKGLWKTVEHSWQADHTIIFVEHSWQADLNIYYCRNQYQAGWRDDRLKYLLN